MRGIGPEPVEIQAFHVACARVGLNAVAIVLNPEIRVRAPVPPDGEDAFERRKPSRIPEIGCVVADAGTEPAARCDRRDDRMDRLLKQSDRFLAECDEGAVVLRGRIRRKQHDSRRGQDGRLHHSSQ